MSGGYVCGIALHLFFFVVCSYLLCMCVDVCASIDLGVCQCFCVCSCVCVLSAVCMLVVLVFVCKGDSFSTLNYNVVQQRRSLLICVCVAVRVRACV